jgi:hypothetical protein
MYGQEIDLFEPLSPTVVITNSSGVVVADGIMPFG